VSVEVDAHRRFVLGIVVCAGLFVTVQHLDHVGWELRLQLELLLVPEGDVRECRAEHQAGDALRAGEDMLLREHPAPRRSEQMDSLESELVAHGSNLVAEDVDSPLDVSRTIRVATADLVVQDDRPLRCEPFERGEVVVR
jgi:hypothetical protein